MAEVGGWSGVGVREYIEGRGKNGRGRWVEGSRRKGIYIEGRGNKRAEAGGWRGAGGRGYIEGRVKIVRDRG